MSAPNKQTLDQRRAQHAWKKITALAVSDGAARSYGGDAKQYAGEAKKLPMRIMSAGLGQALAFILAKATDKKPALRQLHTDLTDWVVKERPMSAAQDQACLLQSIIKGDADFLRLATDEVLAYLNWLNRFAEAEGLKDDA